MGQQPPRPHLPDVSRDGPRRPSSRIRAGLCVHERVRRVGELEAEPRARAEAGSGSSLELSPQR